MIMLARGMFVLGLLVLAQDAMAQNAPRGNLARGRDLYLATGCSNCHGTVGQGGNGGARLVQPRPMPYEAYLAQLRHPAGVMPPYVDAVMPAQDAADIYAFIASLPQPADARTIPLLNN